MGTSRLARRMIAVSTVVALCAIAPSAASAATLAPGNYTAEVTGGSLKVGSSGIITTPIPATSPVPFTVPQGSPTSVSLSGLSLGLSPIAGNNTGVSYTATPTVKSFAASVDPSTGAVTATLVGHVSLFFDGGGLGNGSCTFGTDSAPVTMNLSTENTGGSRWDPSTGAITLVDKAFVIAPTCSGTSGVLTAAVLGALGGTNTPGNNELTVNGLLRFVSPLPTPGDGGGDQNPGGGDTGPGPETTNQDPNTIAACVVPRVKGKKLKRAKRIVRRALCNVSVKRKRSRKKPGTVLRVKPRPGTVLPPGARVTLIVAKR